MNSGLQRRFSSLNVLAVVLAGLVAMPILGVLLNIGSESTEIWSHLAATVLPRYVQNSLVLMIGVAVVTTVVGTGTAWLVAMCRFPGRGVAEWALILPFAVPAYVMAYAYTDFLQVTGPVQALFRDLTGLSVRGYWFPEIRSLGGAVFLLSFAFYPYVYLTVRAAFLAQSDSVMDAARTLGASPFQAFRRVALPLARPALAAGVALALMETLADFGAVSHFAVQTFTTGIYRAWFSMGDRVAASQLAALLLVFVLVLLTAERAARRQARYHQTSGRYKAQARIALTGWRGIAASVACFAPVVLGFVLPAAILVELWLKTGLAIPLGRYWELIANTMMLAVIAGVLAVILAVLLGYAARGGGRPERAAVLIAGTGYAIPGSIIAVGVLIPLTAFDNALDGWLRSSFGVSTGLLLTGSIAALIFGYLVRFLAVALQTIEAGLAKITPAMDAASASLGKNRFETLLGVHAPLLRGSLLAAFLLVMVDVMKELPATLIMRPFNYDTLAVQAYNFASDERLAEAALPSLTIVLAGLVPVIVLSRLIARSRPGARADTDRHMPRNGHEPLIVS